MDAHFLIQPVQREPIITPAAQQRQNSSKQSVVIWILIALIGGCAWGYIQKSSEDVYYSCLEKSFYVSWILKFYPQLSLSKTRRTASGLSIDTLYLTLFGYGSICTYSIFTYYHIQMFDQISDDDAIANQVDVFIVAHATVLTLAIILQIYYFDGCRKFKASWRTRALIFVFIFVNVVLVILIYEHQKNVAFSISLNQWLLSLVYEGGFFLAIRGMPQVWSSYKSRCLHGICLSTICLELFGSFCALGMLLYDRFRYI